MLIYGAVIAEILNKIYKCFYTLFVGYLKNVSYIKYNGNRVIIFW